MIKGSQKQLIVLRTGGSRYFDEAYFVLRREVEPKRCGSGDILTEANKILEESMPPFQRRERHAWKGILLFLGGVLCGACACACAAVFLLL